jgi:hypothetical protein
MALCFFSLCTTGQAGQGAWSAATPVAHDLHPTGPGPQLCRPMPWLRVRGAHVATHRRRSCGPLDSHCAWPRCPSEVVLFLHIDWPRMHRVMFTPNQGWPRGAIRPSMLGLSMHAEELRPPPTSVGSSRCFPLGMLGDHTNSSSFPSPMRKQPSLRKGERTLQWQALQQQPVPPPHPAPSVASRAPLEVAWESPPRGSLELEAEARGNGVGRRGAPLYREKGSQGGAA